MRRQPSRRNLLRWPAPSPVRSCELHDVSTDNLSSLVSDHSKCSQVAILMSSVTIAIYKVVEVKTAHYVRVLI